MIFRVGERLTDEAMSRGWCIWRRVLHNNTRTHTGGDARRRYWSDAKTYLRTKSMTFEARSAQLVVRRWWYWSGRYAGEWVRSKRLWTILVSDVSIGACNLETHRHQLTLSATRSTLGALAHFHHHILEERAVGEQPGLTLSVELGVQKKNR